jgi:hypothetical protein
MSEGPELSLLADALRGLAPSAGRLDRDALLFRAGQAAAPRGPGRWLWPLATALASSLALGLGLALLLRPPVTHTVERVVHVPVDWPAPGPAPPPPVAPPGGPAAPAEEGPSAPPESLPPAGPGRYRQVQENLLRWGLDGVGAPAPTQPWRGRPPDAHSLAQPF